MTVEVTVLVPGDRLAAFQAAMGAYATGGPLPAATPGSTGADWHEATVRVDAVRVADLYSEFGAWLSEATRPDPTPEPSDLDRAGFLAVWDVLPDHEQEMLRLLADDHGRAAGWLELREKLALPGRPSLERDLANLAAACTAAHRRLPVRQEGSGEDAVMFLTVDLVGHVRAAVRADQQRRATPDPVVPGQ